MSDQPTSNPSSIDTKSLAQEIVSALQAADHSRLFVGREEHAEHHEYMRILIDREKERKARNQRIKERMIGSGVVAGALWLLGFIGKHAIGFAQYIMHNPHTPTN